MTKIKINNIEIEVNREFARDSGDTYYTFEPFDYKKFQFPRMQTYESILKYYTTMIDTGLMLDVITTNTERLYFVYKANHLVYDLMNKLFVIHFYEYNVPALSYKKYSEYHTNTYQGCKDICF